jgi:hypothetical protein
MCDDFFDDGFEDDFGDEFSDHLQNGINDEPKEGCDGWCFGDDLADFAIVGGVIGYMEEEIEERKRLEREMKKEDKERQCRSEDVEPNDSDDEDFSH